MDCFSKKRSTQLVSFTHTHTSILCCVLSSYHSKTFILQWTHCRATWGLYLTQGYLPGIKSPAFKLADDLLYLSSIHPRDNP